MGFGDSYHTRVFTFHITDPAAASRINLFRVPDQHSYTVLDIQVVGEKTVSSSTANYWEAFLENGGTVGTAQTRISGTIGGTVGWTAQTPIDGAITAGSGKLTELQWLVFRYNEAGTVAPGEITVNIEVVDGVGSTA